MSHLTFEFVFSTSLANGPASTSDIRVTSAKSVRLLACLLCLVVLTLVTGCSDSFTDCRLTGTCPDDPKEMGCDAKPGQGACATGEPGNGASTSMDGGSLPDASISGDGLGGHEGGTAGGSGTRDSGSAQKPADGSSGGGTDSDVSGDAAPAPSCTSSADCGELLPVCDPTTAECVGCLSNEHCSLEQPICSDQACIACLPESNAGCAAGLNCKAGPSPAENQCVACVSDEQCAGESLCEENECVRCDLMTHAGCSGDTPRCQAESSEAERSCVECLEQGHCNQPAPVCLANFSCAVCDPADHQGCTNPTPRCKSGPSAADHRCVECLGDDDCAKGVCNSYRCVPCLAGNDRGCEGDTPRCRGGLSNENNQCVQCLQQADCVGHPNGQICEDDACVACTRDADCGDASLSRCVANECVRCGANVDCAQIPGKNVCDNGTCVECTGTDFDCGFRDAVPLLCDSVKRQCSEETEGSADVCEPCVADAQCKEGRRCVLTQFEGLDTGYYCLWKERDLAEEAPRECEEDAAPYVSELRDVPSIDGDVGTYCQLALTTCQGLKDFRNKSCDPAKLPAQECGAVGFSDALCKPFGDQHLCTTKCTSSSGCPAGFRCDTTEDTSFCGFIR